MLLLFRLAVHNALAKVKEQMQDGEVIFAFLDDVYALCAPERARDMYDLFAEKFPGGRHQVTHDLEQSRRSSQLNGGIGPGALQE